MISPENEAKISLPKFSPRYFTAESYNSNNNLLCYDDKLKKFALGWCYAENLDVKPRDGQIAVMFDVFNDDNETDFPYYIDEGRYWFHMSVPQFLALFCETFFD